MISVDEIARLSKLRGLKPWQEEKRYIQSLVLFSLRNLQAVLKGGTYLWLFHYLDRFSDDVDYSMHGKMPEPEEVKLTIKDTLSLFGIQSNVKTIKDDSYTLSLRVDTVGPLFRSEADICRVYIEISRREKVILQPLAVKLDEPSYGLPLIFLRGMDLREVAAEKVRAIIRRRKARDVYDLWFLVERKRVELPREIIERKLAFYGSKFEKKDLELAVKDTEEEWGKELASIVFGNLPPFNDVLEAIINWV
jgi:predicted nucleotidyltransferase component of viral defense system